MELPSFLGADDCRKTKIGVQYKGKMSKTKDGLTCQRWDAQSPHAHGQTNPSKYPDASIADAANYCRNPSRNAGGPWCYTESGTRWQSCNVPKCPSEIKG